MGLPKYQQYRTTIHAVERYIERVDSTVYPEDVLKKILALLANSRFGEKTTKGTEVWVNESYGVSIVINPSTRQIVTCYMTEDKRDSPLSMALRDSSDTVIHIISEASAKQRNVSIRTTAEKLAPLYKELAELTDILSRTLRASVIEEHFSRVNQLQKEIATLESERDVLLQELSYLIQEG